MMTNWTLLDDNAKRESFEIILRQSEQLGRMVDDMLAASKADARVLKTNPARIDLREFLLQTIGDLDVDVAIDLDESDSFVVCVDPEHLRRIITNYVENAANYGEPPIRVGVAANAAQVTLRVSDEGEGVDNELAPLLFERFVHGAKPGKLRKGTGLGLSIVRDLARANNGNVFYERNEAGGATFGVVVPLLIDESETARVGD